jgi:hypothetical protein
MVLSLGACLYNLSAGNSKLGRTGSPNAVLTEHYTYAGSKEHYFPVERRRHQGDYDAPGDPASTHPGPRLSQASVSSKAKWRIVNTNTAIVTDLI